MFERFSGASVESGPATQPDPIGLAGGLNLYGYASGDPINYSDPFGLTPLALCLTPVGAPVCTTLGAAAGAVVRRGAALLATTAAAWLASKSGDADETPIEVDHTGKVHELPDELPSGEDALEESARALETSIRNRLREMNKGGGEPGHAIRIRREREALREIERRLRELNKE